LYHKGQNKVLDSIVVNGIKPITNGGTKEILSNLILGYYFLYNNRDDAKPFTFLNKAYILSKKKNETNLYKLSLLGFLELYSKEIVQSSTSFKIYLDEFEQLISTTNDTAWFLYYTNYFKLSELNGNSEYLKTSQKLKEFIYKHQLDTALTARYYADLALYYKLIDTRDSTAYYCNKILALEDYPYLHKIKFNALLDLADINAEENKFNTAENYLNKSKKYINKSDTLSSLFTLERFKAVYYYERIPKYDSAYFNLKSSTYREAQLDIRKNTLKISELNVQLRTKEKENQILTQRALIKKEQEQKKYMWFGGSLTLALGTLIGLLVYRNSKRKQRIAEQQREIEIQKIETLLKEQELTTIDAMILGQEKERQRLAEDLHDSVGATLAAAKLQFSHLHQHKDKLENLEELFTTTGSLLDQAYNEVRSMAHIKNSGVIAKNGLLPAVEKLVKNASIASKLTIEVQDFGLEDRLENLLEITIFRIIQELITNIIKHSEATSANISITNHQDSLSIIVEDNGKGFDIKKIQRKDGMGLSSIERRVEHLEGTMEVDSTEGNGTTILIDIPL